MSAKNKILRIVIRKKGCKKPSTHIACLWYGSSITNRRFYDDAYFHFTPSGLLNALKDPAHLEHFTLLDAKVIGEWF